MTAPYRCPLCWVEFLVDAYFNPKTNCRDCGQEGCDDCILGGLCPECISDGDYEDDPPDWLDDNDYDNEFDDLDWDEGWDDDYDDD